MRLQIIKPGLLSTVQDLGRHHFYSLAVPRSGAMDTLSARIANKALGNADHDAVIEFTYHGAVLLAETDLLIAWAGDGACLKAGVAMLPEGKPLFIPSGTRLTLEQNPIGSRSYLAIAGGWALPEILGSKSTCLTAGFGGYQGRQLRPKDILSAFPEISRVSQKILSDLKGKTISYPLWQVARTHLLPKNRKKIRVITAREWDWFDTPSRNGFPAATYRLDPKSNRMGYHLEGPLMNRVATRELLSTAVTPGTIQVTGKGSLILLMADCQTTGGYPRIAQVIAVDLPLCAQLRQNDPFNFENISLDEAEKYYIDQEIQLHQITKTIENKYLTA